MIPQNPLYEALVSEVQEAPALTAPAVAAQTAAPALQPVQPASRALISPSIIASKGPEPVATQPLMTNKQPSVSIPTISENRQAPIAPPESQVSAQPTMVQPRQVDLQEPPVVPDTPWIENRSPRLDTFSRQVLSSPVATRINTWRP